LFTHSNAANVGVYTEEFRDNEEYAGTG